MLFELNVPNVFRRITRTRSIGLVFCGLIGLGLLACSGDSPLEPTDTGTVLNGADVHSADTNTAVCFPDQSYCNGFNLWECRADGMGYEVKHCPGGCVDGICDPQVCLPNSVSCQSDKILRTCMEDGTGYYIATCVGACENGQCQELPSCVPNSTRCHGDILKTCNEEGTDYDEEECDYGCFEGSCLPPLCVSGVVRCNPLPGSEKVPQQCSFDSTAWVDLPECADTCIEGQCIVQSCVPNTPFCDGKSIKQCNELGTEASLLVDCPLDCAQPVPGQAPVCTICTPGEQQCLDTDTVIACLDPLEGLELLTSCGLSQTCAGGQCVNGLDWDPGMPKDPAWLLFTIHASACWLGGPEGQGLCWTMDTTHLPQPFDAPAWGSDTSIESWFCNAVDSGNLKKSDFVAVAGFSQQALFDGAKDLYGCGTFNLSEFDIKATGGTVLAGKPLGFYCMVFDTYGDTWVTSGDEVHIVECGNND